MYRFIPRIAWCFLVVASNVAEATAEERQLTASGSGFVSGSLQGHDNIAHLGKTFLNVGLESDFLQTGLFLASDGSLESANRDFLQFAFDEEATYFDQATGVVSVTITFTGGTGRFQDVTGSADVLFVFDSNYRQFDFLIDGSIDY